MYGFVFFRICQGHAKVSRRAGLWFALVTTAFWGVWGAFAGRPAENGFPETLIYVVWAFTMIPPSIYALARVAWRLERDPRSLLLGGLIGFTGSGGQMVLFHAVRTGPTYLIFPLVALSPIVTIALSVGWLKERVTRVGALGILLALVALPLFDYAPGEGLQGHGIAWFVCSLIVLAAWGVQAFFIKLANRSMTAESIFFYMTVTALALVYAFRYGKAIVVSPLTNAGAPLITALLSLALLGIVPQTLKIAGIALAFAAAALLAIEPEGPAPEPRS
jgi:uncharacterized membrane protein